MCYIMYRQLTDWWYGWSRKKKPRCFRVNYQRIIMELTQLQ